MRRSLPLVFAAAALTASQGARQPGRPPASEHRHRIHHQEDDRARCRRLNEGEDDGGGTAAFVHCSSQMQCRAPWESCPGGANFRSCADYCRLPECLGDRSTWRRVVSWGAWSTVEDTGCEIYEVGNTSVPDWLIGSVRKGQLQLCEADQGQDPIHGRNSAREVCPGCGRCRLPRSEVEGPACSCGGEGECQPVSSSQEDPGYDDDFRGWYDVQGCGTCNDYCRWVGYSGSGGDPADRTRYTPDNGGGESWWSCRLAGGWNPRTDPGHFRRWSFMRCMSEGSQEPWAPPREGPYECASQFKIGRVAQVARKGLAVDDETFWRCLEDIPGIWPHTQDRLQSIRLFNGGYEPQQDNIVEFVRRTGVKVFLGTTITCDEDRDDMDWSHVVDLLIRLGPDSVLGLSIGNEIDVMTFNPSVSAECARYLWSGGYFRRKFIERTEELNIMQEGFEKVKVTTVLSGFALGGSGDVPFVNRPDAQVNDFLRDITDRYRERFVFTINIYPYFDPFNRMDRGTVDQCTHARQRSLCFDSFELCVFNKVVAASRRKIEHLLPWFAEEGLIWVGETGWSGPEPANGLSSPVRGCGHFSSEDALQHYYENFLAWDLSIGPVKPVDHAFYFTIRNVNGESFGLIENCRHESCKLQAHDAHGCLREGGEVWCPSLSRCVQPQTDSCPGGVDGCQEVCERDAAALAHTTDGVEDSLPECPADWEAWRRSAEHPDDGWESEDDGWGDEAGWAEDEEEVAAAGCGAYDRGSVFDDFARQEQLSLCEYDGDALGRLAMDVCPGCEQCKVTVELPQCRGDYMRWQTGDSAWLRFGYAGSINAGTVSSGCDRFDVMDQYEGVEREREEARCSADVDDEGFRARDVCPGCGMCTVDRVLHDDEHSCQCEGGEAVDYAPPTAATTPRPGQLRTCQGDGQGLPCLFPWVFNGENLNECVDTWNGDPYDLWCYVNTGNSTVRWGKCECDGGTHRNTTGSDWVAPSDP